MMPGVFSLVGALFGIFSAVAIFYHNIVLFFIFLFSAFLTISFQKKIFLKVFIVFVFVVSLAVTLIKIAPLRYPDITDNYLNKRVAFSANTMDFSRQTAQPNSFNVSDILIDGKRFSGIGKVYLLSEPPAPYSKVKINGIIKEYKVNGIFEKLNRNEYIIYADDAKVTRSYYIFRKLAEIRKKIKENTYLSMKSSEAMLFLSSICGITALSYDEKAPFINTGTAHIFAVSGLHIGILGESSRNLFSPFGEGASTASLILVLLFVFLVGFRVSALRAFIMYGVSVLAKLTGKEQIPINTLSFTALLILLLNPLALFSVSFQLSFSAIFALIIVSPIIYEKLPRNWLYRMFSAVFSVQIVLFPIIAFYFHTFSIVSFIANIIVIPFMYVLMPIGIIQLLLSAISLGAAKVFAPITNVAFYMLNKSVEIFARIPYANLNVSFNIYFLLGYFVLLVLTILAFYKDKRLKYFALTGLLIIFILPFILKPSFYVYPLALKGEDGFIVVSNHKTIYITSPTVLQNEEYDSYKIVNALKKNGVNKINLMIFDSPFIERESDSVKLIEKMPVTHIIIPKVDSDLESAFVKLNSSKVDMKVVSLNARINFDNMHFRFVKGKNKNAIFLYRNGKNYLFIGKDFYPLENIPYADFIYVPSQSVLIKNLSFGKLYSY